MHYRKKIKLARITADLNQAQLAEKVGLQQAALSQIESGRREITVTQLMTFAEALDVEAVTLLPDTKQTLN